MPVFQNISFYIQTHEGWTLVLLVFSKINGKVIAVVSLGIEKLFYIMVPKLA